MKLKGIKKVCGETKTLKPNTGAYYQVFVNKKTQYVWADFHYSIGHNEWSEYHSNDIIDCGFVSSPMTMSELKEMVITAIEQSA